MTSAAKQLEDRARIVLKWDDIQIARRRPQDIKFALDEWDRCNAGRPIITPSVSSVSASSKPSSSIASYSFDRLKITFEACKGTIGSLQDKIRRKQLLVDKISGPDFGDTDRLLRSIARDRERMASSEGEIKDIQECISAVLRRRDEMMVEMSPEELQDPIYETECRELTMFAGQIGVMIGSQGPATLLQEVEESPGIE